MDAIDDKSLDACIKKYKKWTKPQLVERLISSGCAQESSTIHSSSKEGLIRNLCGCVCSGFYPFLKANEPQASGENTPELLLPKAQPATGTSKKREKKN